MQGEQLIVKYVSVKNCFAYLPNVYLRKIGFKENVIEVFHGNNKYYFSYDLRPGPDDHKFCLSATFARSLNIKEGSSVFINLLENVPSLTSISVIPKSVEDREILEIQMDTIQSTLLSQNRIVSVGQTMVVWVSKHYHVTLKTESLEPNFVFGKLEQFTEVHVLNTNPQDSTKEEPKQKESTMNSNDSTIENVIKNLLPTKEGNSKNEDSNKKVSSLKDLHHKCKPCVFRVLPLAFNSKSIAQSNNSSEIKMSCPFNVFISKKSLPLRWGFDNGFLCRIKKILNNREVATKDKSQKQNVSFIVKVFFLEDILDKCSKVIDKEYFQLNSIHQNLYLSKSLKLNLKLKKGGKVNLQPMNDLQFLVPAFIEICPCNEEVNLEVFKNYVEQCTRYDRLLLNSSATIVIEDKENQQKSTKCTIRFPSEDGEIIMIDEKTFDSIPVYVSVSRDNEFPIDDDVDENLCNLDLIVSQYVQIIKRCFEIPISECQLTLNLGLGLHGRQDIVYDRDNILIHGSVGSGKTTIIKLLIDILHRSPHFVHTHVIDCRSLKGKKAEVFQKLLTNVVLQCVYYQPSVLFLDDIESITNVSSNDEGNTPDAINAGRITDILINTITQCQVMHYVSIVATCTSIIKISHKLKPSKGIHFFDTIIAVPNLDKKDRIEILKIITNDDSCAHGEIDWTYYGDKTEGWVAQDLVDMAQKTIFNAWKRCVNKDSKVSQVIVDSTDLTNALEQTTPMSLQGIQLYKGSTLTWSDIGGLTDVKKCLIEILQWPLKYPQIFKNAPIKLQSGILLYGMPGTGKTMLAKAITKECGVNLISIKGPELLSKYIGVSEESVRNVFERAQRAKPCVLFFDEFESLAPRRGHDSTGVTDRVVNQLLTQLDGIEDREGVVVIAASSRPDLLDPALLRPGRLDKSLYCPLPDEMNRKEILIALCKSHNISIETLEFDEIAELTPGFTGADLYSIITQAKLFALEEVLEIVKDEQIEENLIQVYQTHLLRSTRSTNSSLSLTEKQMYNNIYARFSRNNIISNDILKNQKSTLA